MIGYFRKAIAAKRPAILNERNRLWVLKKSF
jgi:hypothetical protein